MKALFLSYIYIIRFSPALSQRSICWQREMLLIFKCDFWVVFLVLWAHSSCWTFLNNFCGFWSRLQVVRSERGPPIWTLFNQTYIYKRVKKHTTCCLFSPILNLFENDALWSAKGIVENWKFFLAFLIEIRFKFLWPPT